MSRYLINEMLLVTGVVDDHATSTKSSVIKDEVLDFLRAEIPPSEKSCCEPVSLV